MAKKKKVPYLKILVRILVLVMFFRLFIDALRECLVFLQGWMRDELPDNEDEDDEDELD